MKVEMKRVVRKRLITGLIQTVILFGIFFGISFLQGTDAGRAAFTRAAFFSIMTGFGYTFNRLFNDIHRHQAGYRRWYYAGTAAGMVIAVFGLWQSMVSFDGFMTWPGELSLSLLIGISFYAVSLLSNYREQDGEGLWWELLGWLQTRSLLKFGFGMVLGVYLGFLRSYVSREPDLLLIIDWILFCGVALGILFKVWMSISHRSVDIDSNETWRKHDPEIEKSTGASQETLIRIERQFINVGEATTLFVMLTVLLYENGVDETAISQALDPLMNFKGIHEVRQANVRLSRKASHQQYAMRREALDTTFSTIENATHAYRTGVTSGLSSGSPGRKKAVSTISLHQASARFLNEGDASDLFTGLIIASHRNGRHYEHITSDIRRLTGDNGKPSEKSLNELLLKLNIKE